MHWRWVATATAMSVLAAWSPATPAAGQALLDRLDIELHGFLDVRGGLRTQSDAVEDDESLAEARLQLEFYRAGEAVTWQVRADLLYDDVIEEHDVDLEDGSGAVDLREACLLASPLGSMDLKAGRQILTWGTGDLLFINDLFPKDWQSFFVGRDEEYLKAPSDAVLCSFFLPLANIDVAYTPRFDADRYISGERISYWSPALGERAGRNAVVPADKPDGWFEDDEVALRVYRNVGSTEVAAYGYNGYWKSPAGFDPLSGQATFPELRVLGASVRRPVGKALANIEAGCYSSRQDTGGDDPTVPNSEVRLLAGYERELARDFTGGLQYYLEHMQDFASYRSSLPDGQPARDRDRHVLTLRLTRRMLNQNLVLSAFAYYSPSDGDAYVRPSVKHKLNDAWLLFAGGNIFVGDAPHTFFGQFEDNSNVYAGARYVF